MYINERDEINYHGFLYAQRMLVDATMNQVCTGLCTESEIHRAELGKRQPEKLLRDRIAARLGVSGEEYEDYLNNEEYKEWQLRQYILKALDKDDLGEAERGINDLATYKRRTKVQKQFVETMRYILRQKQGAPKDELKAILKKAIAFTVPNIDKALDGAHLLADQELNLILEYFDLQGANMEQYERIISWVDGSHMDAITKSKIYPRIACKLTKVVLESENVETRVVRAIEVCENAIEYLRKTNRLYYFIEALECHSALLAKLKLHGYKAVIERNTEWIEIFQSLYEEHGVSPYMPSFCYLYWESECHSIVEVLEVRRGMTGLSRVKLADDICTDKTIIRYERYGRSPNIAIVRDLFERMGLCAEYKRARVITSSSETLYLASALAIDVNNYRYEEVENKLSQLKERLNLDISFNRQEIIRLENLLLKVKKEIAGDELKERYVEALETTISFNDILRKPIRYLTRAELTCMNILVLDTKGEEADICRDIFEKLCLNILKRDMRPGRVPVYELLIDVIAGYYGDMGKYDESTALSNKILKECLKYRRMFKLSYFIYNNLWNEQEKSKQIGNNLDEDYIREQLHKSIMISKINYRTHLATFFQQKYDELSS